MLLGSLALAETQGPATLPNNLKCKEILNVIGNDNLGTIILRNLNSQPEGRGTNMPSGTVRQSQDNDQVVIDFTDGDQTESLTFKKEEMTDLTAGNRKSIRGLHAVGFWWADGDHTSDLAVVECEE
jgi:hypothetical protein